MSDHLNSAIILADDAARETWGDVPVRMALTAAERGILADIILAHRDTITAKTGGHTFTETAARSLADHYGRGPNVPLALVRSWDGDKVVPAVARQQGI